MTTSQTLVLEGAELRRAREKYRENPDRHRVKHANRRAKAYGAPGVLTVDDVKAVMAEGKCHYCGASDRLGIDHVVPLHSGGPNVRDNIVAACLPCNSSKGRKDRPHRWSWTTDACESCGRTDRRHFGRGMCTVCYPLLTRPKVGRWSGQKLTPDAVRHMRQLWDGGNTSFQMLAGEFGVHVQTVKDILQGRTWRTVH